MIGRRAVIGLSLLCALAFSAIAATGAMAETKTTTAFTCVPAEGGEGFSREHCSAADAVSVGAKFKHAEITANSWTPIHASNEKTAEETKKSTEPILHAIIGGLKATITCKTMTTTGELENFFEGGVMDVKGRNVVIKFEGCVLSGTLATIESCKINEEKITTNELESTSLVNTMEAEYKPQVGKVFATFKLKECKTAKLNETTFEVLGTSKAISDGATIETNEATSAGLTVAGQAAQFTSKSTLRMINAKKELENPISATTVVDP
jgi:hypothetical protein